MPADRKGWALLAVATVVPLAENFKEGKAVTNHVSLMIGREAVLLEAVLLDTGSEETVDLEKSILFSCVQNGWEV